MTPHLQESALGRTIQPLRKRRSALLIGSSFSAVPILFALKKYGLHVSVCGNYKSDPCHEIADASFFIDYSDATELELLVRSEKFDFLIPSCNDSSYLSCAKFAEKAGYLGFDSVEASASLHNKKKFRELTRELNISSPRYIEVSEGGGLDKHTLGFPVIVKPVDSFSGRGMTKVSRAKDLRLAINFAQTNSNARDVIVEEFIDGSLHSHSAFVVDGQIVYDFFVDEFCTTYPYQVNCSNHPSLLGEDQRKHVRAAVSKIVQKKELTNGLIHTQFLSKDGHYWIVESMRRCPGDLYGTLIAKSTGIDYTDLFVRSFIGEPLPHSLGNYNEIPFGRHTLSSDRAISTFSFSQSIPASKIDLVPLKSSGHVLQSAPYDKLAILFAQFESLVNMETVTRRMRDFIEITSP